MKGQVTAGQPSEQLRPFPARVASETSLPAPVTTLIGREEEIEAACALLCRDDVRLLTFTGPGGVGKTQLALAVARKLSDDFAEGVAFVPLAPIADHALVAPAIAQAFDVRESGTRPLLDGLRDALRNQELLLLLDNFEHVTIAAPVVIDLLSASPKVKILITSRELLHLSGEHAFEVPPLDLPDGTRSVAVDELTTYAAIDLFITRAREIKTDFALTDATAAAVADVCRRLDGLPLALELAAARVRVLAPAELLAQLTNRLQLLTGGRRDAPERLQTMRQAITWSYELLTPDEQRLFRRLSVFVGGFTLEGADAVGDADSVLDGLASLVDKSLVQQLEQPDGETRFSMLETIRDFGLERLEATDEAVDVRMRHAYHILAFAEKAHQTPQTDAKKAVGRRIQAELPNYRAAMKWADRQHDAELLLRLAIAPWWFWEALGVEALGSTREVCIWLERTIEATTTVPRELRGLRAQLLASAALTTAWWGDTDRVAVLADEASSLARETGNARALAMANLSAGHIALWLGNWDRARIHLSEALTQWRLQGEPVWIVATLYRLGYLAGLQSKDKESESWFTEALEVARAAGWSVPIAECLEALGTCARERRDYRPAAILFAEALQLVRDGGDDLTVANCFKSLGAVAAVTGNPVQAARLFGAAESIWVRTGFAPPAVEQPWLEMAYAPARAQLSPEVFADAWSAGRNMHLAQAIAEAMEVARVVTSETPSGLEAPAGLTPREHEVLRLLVEGLSDKQIAEALGISRRTASKHVEIILSKLDVPSRTAAATYATRNGLI